MIEGPLCLHLFLDEFKNTLCNQSCLKKPCTAYHSAEDRRRPFTSVRYSKFICSQHEKCTAINCPYSHNLIEQLYHPDNYKRKFCAPALKSKFCAYQSFCAYAHSEYELKIIPLHLFKISYSFFLFRFKSEMCPFNSEHDKFTCVYAHNWQDFKRPYFPELQPQNCPKWNFVCAIKTYDNGCPDGYSCKFCHGWKELEYHPSRFKQKQCKSDNCAHYPVCPMLHPEDKLYDWKQNPFFYPTPKALHYQIHSTTNYLAFVGVEISSKVSKINSNAPQAISINPSSVCPKESKNGIDQGRDTFDDSVGFDDFEPSMRSNNALKIHEDSEKKIKILTDKMKASKTASSVYSLSELENDKIPLSKKKEKNDCPKRKPKEQVLNEVISYRIKSRNEFTTRSALI